LGDPDFLGYIDDLSSDLLDEFAAEASKRDQGAALQTFTKVNYPPPTQANLTEEDNTTKAVAAKAAKNLGLEQAELFRTAANTEKGKTKSLSRAIAYRRSADIGETDQANRAWALNNSASI
jgi:hypothetical protein